MAGSASNLTLLSWLSHTQQCMYVCLVQLIFYWLKIETYAFWLSSAINTSTPWMSNLSLRSLACTHFPEFNLTDNFDLQNPNLKDEDEHWTQLLNFDPNTNLISNSQLWSFNASTLNLKFKTWTNLFSVQFENQLSIQFWMPCSKIEDHSISLIHYGYLPSTVWVLCPNVSHMTCLINL